MNQTGHWPQIAHIMAAKAAKFKPGGQNRAYNAAFV